MILGRTTTPKLDSIGPNRVSSRFVNSKVNFLFMDRFTRRFRKCTINWQYPFVLDWWNNRKQHFLPRRGENESWVLTVWLVVFTWHDLLHRFPSTTSASPALLTTPFNFILGEVLKKMNFSCRAFSLCMLAIYIFHQYSTCTQPLERGLKYFCLPRQSRKRKRPLLVGKSLTSNSWEYFSLELPE